MTTPRETADPTSLQKTQRSADHIGEANEKVADHIGDATTMIDHAELARLAGAATRGDWRAHITTKRPPEIYTNVPPPNTPNPKIAVGILRKADARFIAAANPATVLALLSEIAALRVREAALIDGKTDMFRGLTQAERQRDEAVGLLRKATGLKCDDWRGFASFKTNARALLANQGADQ